MYKRRQSKRRQSKRFRKKSKKFSKSRKIYKGGVFTENEIIPGFTTLLNTGFIVNVIDVGTIQYFIDNRNAGNFTEIREENFNMYTNPDPELTNIIGNDPQLQYVYATFTRNGITTPYFCQLPDFLGMIQSHMRPPYTPDTNTNTNTKNP
jgi:hypothetical protein